MIYIIYIYIGTTYIIFLSYLEPFNYILISLFFCESSSMEKCFPACNHVLNRAVLAVFEFSSQALFQASITQSGISLASGFFSFLGSGVSLDGPLHLS